MTTKIGKRATLNVVAFEKWKVVIPERGMSKLQNGAVSVSKM
jgi:hypothetical protein